MNEYKVRPVGRFIVTQFYDDAESHNGKAGSRVIGEYDRRQDAQLAARAMALADGGAYTSNVMPDGDVQERLRNICELFCAHADDGVLVINTPSGIEAFGLGPAGDSHNPHTLMEMGVKRLMETRGRSE